MFQRLPQQALTVRRFSCAKIANPSHCLMKACGHGLQVNSTTKLKVNPLRFNNGARQLLAFDRLAH